MIRSSIVLSLCLLLICLTAQQIQGQEARRDSLKQAVETLPDDTLKVNTLIQLAFEMRYIDANALVRYARQANQLAKSIGFQKGATQSTRNIGLGHNYLGNLDSALYFCYKAEKEAEEFGFIQIQADALNTIGNTYFRKSEYDSARMAWEKSVVLFRKINNEESIAISEASVAVSYSELGKYSKAIEMFQNSLLSFEKVNNLNAMANVYNNVANIYQERNELDKAYEYYLKTSEYDSITGNKSGRAHTLSNLGNILVDLERNEEAKQSYWLSIYMANSSGSVCSKTMALTQLGELYLSEQHFDSAQFYIYSALELAKECENDRRLASVYLDLGDFHKAQGRLNQAEDAYLEGFSVASSNEIKPKMEELARALSELYEGASAFVDAYKYLKIANKLQDELFNKESTERITRLEAEFEFEKEKQEMAEEQNRKELAYEQQLARERWIRIGVIGLAISVAIIALFAYRGYKIKKLANVQLSEKNQHLKELRESEKRLSEEAIASKERELATMAMASHEKNALLKDLEQKVSFIEKRMGDELRPSLKDMKKAISDSYSLDKSWDSFLHRFEDVHPQFFDRLKGDNPNLTIEDLKLSAYLKIGMSNKEIANVTHLTLGSVKSKINRLKKKLEVGPEDSVRDFMIQYA